MKVVILDKEVRQNIAVFRHLIHRQADKERRFFRTAKKAYKGYINCKTGELQFPELQQKELPAREWKAITIRLHPEDEGAFEVFSEEEGCFDCSGLEKDSYAMLTKTMHILNQLAYDPKRGKNPFWVLKHVSVLDLILAEKEERGSLVHEAWHNIDRSHAEYILSNHPVGTYLFRKDEFAQILEDSLNESLSSPIVCITLTYRRLDKKIGEKTLVYKDNRWQFYNDDPTLVGPSYSSVKELLDTMGEQLQQPAQAA